MGKRGPPPQGEAALTPAERQARYRAARQAGKPAVRYRKPGDRRTRPQRWKNAVAELVELQASYQDWLDSLPENLRDSATAEGPGGSVRPRLVRTGRRGATARVRA